MWRWMWVKSVGKMLDAALLRSLAAIETAICLTNKCNLYLSDHASHGSGVRGQLPVDRKPKFRSSPS